MHLELELENADESFGFTSLKQEFENLANRLAGNVNKFPEKPERSPGKNVFRRKGTDKKFCLRKSVIERALIKPDSDLPTSTPMPTRKAKNFLPDASGSMSPIRADSLNKSCNVTKNNQSNSLKSKAGVSSGVITVSSSCNVTFQPGPDENVDSAHSRSLNKSRKSLALEKSPKAANDSQSRSVSQKRQRSVLKEVGVNAPKDVAVGTCDSLIGRCARSMQTSPQAKSVPPIKRFVDVGVQTSRVDETLAEKNKRKRRRKSVVMADRQAQTSVQPQHDDDIDQRIDAFVKKLDLELLLPKPWARASQETVTKDTRKKIEKTKKRTSPKAKPKAPEVVEEDEEFFVDDVNEITENDEDCDRMNSGVPWRAPSGLRDPSRDKNFTVFVPEDSLERDLDDESFLPKPPKEKKVFVNRKRKTRKSTIKRSTKKKKLTSPKQVEVLAEIHADPELDFLHVPPNQNAPEKERTKLKSVTINEGSPELSEDFPSALFENTGSQSKVSSGKSPKRSNEIIGEMNVTKRKEKKNTKRNESGRNDDFIEPSEPAPKSRKSRKTLQNATTDSSINDSELRRSTRTRRQTVRPFVDVIVCRSLADYKRLVGLPCTSTVPNLTQLEDRDSLILSRFSTESKSSKRVGRKTSVPKAKKAASFPVLSPVTEDVSGTGQMKKKGRPRKTDLVSSTTSNQSGSKPKQTRKRGI